MSKKLLANVIPPPPIKIGHLVLSNLEKHISHETLNGFHARYLEEQKSPKSQNFMDDPIYNTWKSIFTTYYDDLGVGKLIT